MSNEVMNNIMVKICKLSGRDITRLRQSIDLLDELNDVMKQSGGSPLTWEDCMKMSLAEFIYLAVPNEIGFHSTSLGRSA